MASTKGAKRKAVLATDEMQPGEREAPTGAMRDCSHEGVRAE